MQPMQMPKINKAVVEASNVKTIDFTKAYKFCLLECKEKPTASEFKVWLLKNKVKVHPSDFLKTIYEYEKGVQNV